MTLAQRETMKYWLIMKKSQRKIAHSIKSGLQNDEVENGIDELIIRCRVAGRVEWFSEETYDRLEKFHLHEIEIKIERNQFWKNIKINNDDNSRVGQSIRSKRWRWNDGLHSID